MAQKRTYTVTEAAELVGLSRKAISRRVDRGSLRSVVRNGRRLIPRSELVRAGLLPESGDDRGYRAPFNQSLSPLDGPEGDAPTTLVPLVQELLDRVERQANELAQFRALTVQAESLRADRELADLRARLAHLEGRTAEPGGPLQGHEHREPAHPAQPRYPTTSPAAASRIWLPPNAAPDSHSSREPLRPPRTPRTEQGYRSRSRRRFVGFLVKAAFIVAVALGAGLAHFSPLGIVVAVMLAWALVAATEAFAWLRRDSDRQDEV